MRLLEFVRLVKPNYKPDWFHELLAEHLEACVDGSLPNLLISTPPGHGKTELVMILFPAWLLAQSPNEHIIELSNSDTLAKMASGNVLRILNHPALQEAFPLTFDKETEGSFTIHGNDGRASSIIFRRSQHPAKPSLPFELPSHLPDVMLRRICEVRHEILPASSCCSRLRSCLGPSTDHR